jgi:WD40 repeat protein
MCWRMVAIVGAQAPLILGVGVPFASGEMWATPAAHSFQVRLDTTGDPLPCGVSARLGTTRLRHGRPIIGLAVSPDGTMVSADEQEVCVWRPGDHRLLLRVSDRFIGSRRPLAFSAKGSLCAWCSHERVPHVEIWRMATRSRLASLPSERNASPVFCLALSPDDRHIAVGVSDGTITLWETGSGRESGCLDGQGNDVRCVAYSPDARSLVSGHGDGTIVVWSIPSGRVVRRLKAHTDVVRFLAFCGNPDLLASSGQDGHVFLWNLSSERPLPLAELSHRDAGPIAASADGKSLAVASASGLTIYDIAKRSVREDASLVRFHWAPIALLKDGCALASTFNSVTVVPLRDAASHSSGAGHRACVTTGAFVAGSSIFASGSEDQTVRLWDVRDGRQIRDIRLCRGTFSYIASVAVFPDGKLLACADGTSPTIALWSAESNRPMRELNGHTSPVTCLACAPDNTTIASGSADRTIRLWDRETGKTVQIMKGHGGDVTSVAFSPDGAQLASAAWDGCRLWNVRSGREVRAVSALLPPGGIQGLAFSPSGELLAIRSRIGRITAWDLRTGKEAFQFEPKLGPVASTKGSACLSFSRDGKILVSAGPDATIRCVCTRTGRLLRTLDGHRGSATLAVFSPDGRRLVSGSSDTTLLVWETQYIENGPSKSR